MIRKLRLFSVICLVLIATSACRHAYAVSWFPFGPDGGSARAFAEDPRDPQHIYLGAANGWVYQTRDGGAKWERLAQIDKRDDLVIDNIVVDPADPRHLVLGAWASTDLNRPDGGVYISHDGGASWVVDGAMKGQSVRALTDAPSDPKILVAGTLAGVYRSMDGGESWKLISPEGSKEIHEIESLAVDPVNPDVIYAGTWHLPWKTTDGGKNWAIMKQGVIEDSDVFSIIVDPKQPKTVYLSACSGIYKSVDGGGKFSGGVGVNKGQGIPSTARRTRVLMQDPNNPNTVFAGTTEGLYRTFDAGKYWMQTTGPDVIVNDVFVDPRNSKHVLLATDRRGVLASNDGGDSFVPSNAGFSARQITAFTGDVNHAATVYVGVVNDKESGGVFVSRTGALSWQHLSAGLDGHDVFSLGQAPDGSILAGTEHGIYRLRDSMWERVANDATMRRGDPPARPRAAGRRVAERTRTSVRGHGQTAVGVDGSIYGLTTDGETMFAATSQGLLKSVSSGMTWSLVEGALPADCEFVASQKTTIAAASLSALAVSGDGGKTWRAATLPKPGMQITALAVDGRGAIWLGDRDGAYWSADKGATWQPLNYPYMRKVNNIFYDAGGNRMLVTAGSGTKLFSVAVTTERVSETDTGWDLRFVRPVGSYLVGATLFDGIVVQPRMVDSAEVAKH
ncbi:MAG TPA: hypothetical protein VG714_05120 [Acidobacteriaceae bacterium]|nr:hypothetical protein [Acidobacteriaceae bacterium]